jgi:hypothetical protein
LDKVSNLNSPWKEQDYAGVDGKRHLGVCQLRRGATSNPKDLDAHTLKDVKARRIILNGVKDHLIPHLSGKKSANAMWEALKSLFQSKNENRIMVLREKLRDTKMT